VTALHVAPGLKLDADYIGGGTLALLAKKGAGKSYTARVLAEEMWKAKIPFVFIDPMGTSWGLRAGADGDVTGGLPVPIFGGEKHADAPLERTGGALMADLVVDEGVSMILDLSALGTRSAERQFAHDFFDRLYRSNRELVHLLVDEADLFAPQKPQPGDAPLLGVTENIVRRGRNRGIGITLITQRPAVLNKDVLTQVDGLVAMRIVGKQDREAINEWVKGHGDQEAAAAVQGTLAGLGNGECWWWIPELDILKRVQVRQSETFDSSPTKRIGESRREPKSLAEIDMGAIATKMEATIERAKADDPKELRKRIAELERDLKKRPTEEVVREVPIEIEKPVFNGEIERLEEVTGAVTLWVTTIEQWREELLGAVNKVAAVVAEAKGVSNATLAPARPATRPEPAPRPARAQPRSTAAPADEADTPGVTPAKQRLLDALAALEAIGVTQAHKTQLALFAKASPKSSAYSNNLGALRTAGLVDYPVPAHVALTASGRAIADPGTVPTTDAELWSFVRGLVGPAKARILDSLIAEFPNAIDRDELAIRAGASTSSSAYSNNLGSLRSLGLIDYPTRGMVVAEPILFIE
jgi:helicase HerA-like protein